jgi:hypothetical protein
MLAGRCRQAAFGASFTGLAIWTMALSDADRHCRHRRCALPGLVEGQVHDPGKRGSWRQQPPPPVAIDAQGLLGDNLFELASRQLEAKAWLGGLESDQDFAAWMPAQRPGEINASPHADTRAISLILSKVSDRAMFAAWRSLSRRVHGKSTLRGEGLLDIAGADSPVVIHAVQQLIYPPVHRRGCSAGERESVLVFILHSLDPARTEASLHDHLGRFPGGNRPPARWLGLAPDRWRVEPAAALALAGRTRLGHRQPQALGPPVANGSPGWASSDCRAAGADPCRIGAGSGSQAEGGAWCLF